METGLGRTRKRKSWVAVGLIRRNAAAIRGKKDKIEDAARELFMKQGFHATSMRDISKRAEVSLGNLYNYYRTKESILESIINRYLTVIDEHLKTIFAEILESVHS